ncbi:MAG: hypothetical protein ACI80H_000421 [Pseudoalteromonas distincta]|jgi:hypothetical protein
MKKSNLIVLLIIGLLFIGGCKSKRNSSTAESINAVKVQQFWDDQFDSEYLEARGKASVTLDGGPKNVSMHLKMKKDSLIWGKFSLFGIGVTVLITPDSFFMVNTLAQTYSAYDNSYVNQLLGFKVTISQLQNLLVGNAIFVQKNYRLRSVENQLVGSDGMATNTISMNDVFRTLSSSIETGDTSQRADIQYENYELLGAKQLPKNVVIDVKKGAQNLNVVLNYQNVNTNVITTFPFKVPNGFNRK